MKKFISKLMIITGTEFIMLSCTMVAPYQVDPQFKPYLEDFLEEAWSRGINLKNRNLVIEWKAPEDLYYVALSHKNRPGKIVIWVDPGSFKANNEADKAMMIFHEFGHAFLDRGHELGAGSISLMKPGAGMYNPVMHDLWANDRNVLLDELFDNRNRKN